jgi:hypothetical protein
MAIKVFESLLAKAQKAGVLAQKTTDARAWLQDAASRTRVADTTRVIQQGVANSRVRKNVTSGQLFLFKYDAKTKDDLPYYDKFPLVFPFRRVSNGFYGINMHYLPLNFRAMLMDSLYDNINNNAQDETTKLRITYNILSGAAKFRYFRPCVKYYLNSHVDSQLIYIEPKEWDMALFLPLHKFSGASASAVYKDSRKTIAGR